MLSRWFWLHLISHLGVAMAALGIFRYTQSLAETANPYTAWLIIPESMIISGIILSHLIHEWGHFIGAVASGAQLTIKQKISPLFFDFDYLNNHKKHYLCMSVGGPAGNVLLLMMLVIFLGGQDKASHWLTATVIGQLVYVLVLEGPVSLGILQNKKPIEVLSQHFGQGRPLFVRSLIAGIATGLLSLILLRL